MTWKNSAQILAINHAGEWGAIHFYTAQLWMSERLFPQAVNDISEFLDNEYKHIVAFDRLITQRSSQYCRELWLWQYGGVFLGVMTALLGAKSAMAATHEFEKCVIQHLDSQLCYLKDYDIELHHVVTTIYADEQRHGAVASPYLQEMGWLYAPVRWGVRIITETLMFMSKKRYE